MKIDVDGFELEVLRGGRTVLGDLRPRLIVEVNHATLTRDIQPSELLRELAALGCRRATVLDHENYLLEPPSRRGWPESRTEVRATDLSVTFDRRPVMLPDVFVPGGLIGELPLVPEVHGHGIVLSDGDAQHVAAPGPQWAYAVSFAIPDMLRLEQRGIVTVDVAVKEGSVGLGLVDRALATMVAPERLLVTGPSTRVAIQCDDLSSAHHLVVRNSAPGGATARVVVTGAWVHQADAAASDLPEWDSVPEVDLRRIGARLGLPTAGDAEPLPIRICGVEDLHEALGVDEFFVPLRLVFDHGLDAFSMERDDAVVLRYLYRVLSPRRHFEFGTWQGFGASLVAEASEAEVWTINLPDGERDEAGSAIYSDQDGVVTDAGPRIGWRYRAAGFAERVHQILGDSRQLDLRGLPEGTFDTVLIDGGHSAEVVSSDTALGIRLLRPGGWLIWHDLCPDEAALRQSAAGRGVLEAFLQDGLDWSTGVEEPIWIRPSWLCLARRR